MNTNVLEQYLLKTLSNNTVQINTISCEVRAIRIYLEFVFGKHCYMLFIYILFIIYIYIDIFMYI